MKRWFLGIAASLLVVAAGPVHAITMHDVIGLTRADANDAVVMAKIDADGTVFQLTVDDILELKAAGVSNAVITYMINTGKFIEDFEEVPAEEEFEQEAVDDGYYEGENGYTTSVDAQYASYSGFSFSIGFGGYYPYWPGYSWGFYYGPYSWGWRPYYYYSWVPYPYYGYGYGNGYGCGYCGYSTCRTYHNYPYHGGSHYAKYGGRVVGNRGASGGDRVIKGGATPYESSRVSSRSTAGNYKSRTPGTQMVDNSYKPGASKTVRANRGSQGVKSPRQARVIRSQPTPTKQVRTSNGSARTRSVQSGPARQKSVRKQPTSQRRNASQQRRTTQAPTKTRTKAKATSPRKTTTKNPSRVNSRSTRSHSGGRSAAPSMGRSGGKGFSGGGARSGGGRSGGSSGSRGGGSRSGKP